ncbi:transposase [Candidatus Neptunichlamydia sp. REUL1]|uniref:transposase n=1 Tax=Candidatus Neptunichlamydia sp. REUL1 TaxID=3064277 RepID=UPI00292E5EDD|nr:transposase [Candidatus Neptunochlamydia sp. REUL1]
MKKFDEEFKANAVRLVREERMKIKDVAHDLGIGKSTLSYWLGLNRKGELIKTASQKKEDEAVGLVMPAVNTEALPILILKKNIIC